MAYTVLQAAAGSPKDFWKGETFVYPFKETALAILKWAGILLGALLLLGLYIGLDDDLLLLIARFLIRRHYRKVREARRRRQIAARKRQQAALRQQPRPSGAPLPDNITYWPGTQPVQRPPRRTSSGGRR